MRAEPPRDLAAERAVLGAILLGGAPTLLEALGVLTGWEACYSDAHRRIGAAMQRVAASDRAIDLVTVAAELEAEGVLDRVGDRPALADLLDAVSTSANVTYHAGIVRQHFARRQLMAVAEELGAAAADLAVDPHAAAARCTARIVPAALAEPSRAFLPFAQVLTEVHEDLLHRDALRHAGGRVGFRSYLPELDDLLDGGPEPGDLVSVMGVPGSGKSMFAFQWAVNAAVDGGDAVAIISAEMTRRAVGVRALQQVGSLRARPFRDATFTPRDSRRYQWAVRVLQAAPLYVDDATRPTIEDVAMKARLLKLQHPGLRAIVVDFLQLIGARDHRADTTAELLTAVSYQLKGLAKELQLVVVSLVQPNVKEIRRRLDQRPEVSDAQGSSGIEQASDQMLLLWPKWEVKPDVAGKPVHIIVAKNRHGARGEIALEWEAEYMRMTSPRRSAIDRERAVRLGDPDLPAHQYDAREVLG